MTIPGQLEERVNDSGFALAAVSAPPGSPAERTPAQRSNLLTLTALGYQSWREQSLTLLTGRPLPLSREAAYFGALCRPQAGQAWLDIGTSSGFYAGVLARAGARVLACDISPAMLKVAARRETSPLIQYALLDAERSGLPDQSFDGVTIGATLNETARPRQMLAEAARLLRPGGQLWLMTLARDGSGLQAALGRFGGLSFPDEAQLHAWLPQLEAVGSWRRANVLFGQWIKA
ncbi:class I SAM-dependent methyltransferase [Deinococcus alpinitundrae]|uniref:class I SAM-dependent methyltransferase n=1 Tax=Deinococcus alpinitundrae TaxID=468913 RepID=UPI00137A4806|nr:class I SAM-dependent methyltransferase [Deinococcus alpinitundrae]